MFVFKAAVVGAGTMGGEIAQVIAAADIPVVLKDVDQKFVDVGLEKAREVTEGQVARLVKKEKITEEQGREQVEAVLGRITGTTAYDGFGDVDFVIEAVPERMEIKQAVFAELDAVTPGHAILASNTSSLSITEIGDATLPAREGRRLPLLLPGVGHAAARDRPRRRHRRRRRVARRGQLRADDPQAADHLRRGPGLRRQPRSSTRRCPRSGARRRSGGLSIKKIDEAIQEAKRAPMGPFFLVDLLGLDTVLHVAEHLAEQLRATASTSTRACSASSPSKQLGAKTGGAGFYEDGEPQIAGDADAAGRPARAHGAEGRRRGVPAARGGRRVDARDRPRHDGRRRHGPAPRDPAAAHVGRHHRPRRRCSRSSRTLEEQHGDRFAPPAILRKPRRARAASARRAGQGFFPWPRARRGLRRGPGPARDARRLRDRLAEQPAGQLAVARGHPRAEEGVGARSTARYRALVIASANPLLFCAGADIKAFTKMDEAGGRELLDRAHGAAALVRAVLDGDDRRGQRDRLRRRLRAGDGLRRAHRRRLGALRPARDQPRHHPRLRRHPAAAAAGGRGQGAGDEPHRRRDPRRRGLRVRPRQRRSSRTTSCSTPRSRGRASSPARRRWRSQQIKEVSGDGDLDEGIEAEKAGASPPCSAREDAKEGIGAFLGKRSAEVAGTRDRAESSRRRAPGRARSARRARSSR